MTRISTTGPDGITPTLEELVALRAGGQRAGLAKRGAYGRAGLARSTLRGRGMEYAESREYVAGDDARYIDWKLTARTGKTQTKLFQADRERLTLLVADTSAALYFGTRVRFKSVQAARVGAVAAWHYVRQGDRLSIVRGATSDRPITPSGGTQGVLRVLDALARWYGQRPVDDLGLTMALQRAVRMARPGSRVVVLADPASAAAVPATQWGALSVHHELIVVLLVDALELDPPPVSLPMMANGQRIEVDLDGAATRQRWSNAFSAPISRVREALSAHRAQLHVVHSDDDSDAWLGATPLTRSA